MGLASDDARKQVTLVDISRAYFNAVIKRRVFVELPPEAGRGRGVVGELQKCMYGTRDAAQGWEQTYRDALEYLGFVRGRASPCIFVHSKRDIHLTVHGDDFFAAGLPADLSWFERALLARFEGKVKGRLAHANDELRILNRVARRTHEGYEWEADQRHAGMLICGEGVLPESRGLSAPGRKQTKEELDREDVPLEPAAASEYRARAARANFMAVDRPDVTYAVKELCRGMSSPTRRDSEALKRLARYLLVRPRVVLHFGWQHKPTILSVYTDSDWAGCVRTRKSTSGGVVMRGSHVLKTWSTTQATVALSSAEAELIALVKGAAEGLAVTSLLRDLREDVNIRVGVDSSAAIGVCRRTGVGKIRHLDTRLLWVQDMVRAGSIVVEKVAGEENPADLLTKHLASDVLTGHLARLACWPRKGRANIAPRCTGL